MGGVWEVHRRCVGCAWKVSRRGCLLLFALATNGLMSDNQNFEVPGIFGGVIPIMDDC